MSQLHTVTKVPDPALIISDLRLPVTEELIQGILGHQIPGQVEQFRDDLQVGPVLGRELHQNGTGPEMEVAVRQCRGLQS